MPLRTFMGTTSDDWDVTGNWLEGVVPINDDSVVLSALAVRGPQTNVDQTAKNGGAGIDLDLLYSHPGFKYAVGSSGNPLKVGCDKLVVMGSGEFWYQNAPAGLDTDIAYITAATPGTLVNLGGDTITELFALRGTIALDATLGAMTRLHVGYMDTRQSDVTLKINSAAGTLTDLFQGGGRVFADNLISNAVVYGGELEKGSTTAITVLDVMATGNVIYNSSGTITTARVRGRLDLTKSSDAKTITTCIIFPGGDLKKIDELHTFTNPIVDLRAVA